MLEAMIDTKKVFNKLTRDIEDASPNLRKALKEISPISIFLNIKGHKDIFITIDGNNSDISFQKCDYSFEIRASLTDLMKVMISGQLNKNLIFGDAETAIVLFNAIFDLIYLVDKYFGSLPAVFTYTLMNNVFSSSDEQNDKGYVKIRRRLRGIAIRLDRLEALKVL